MFPNAFYRLELTFKRNISGIGNHFGGSCQVGFSVDGGKTFRVATSYEGNCPHRNNGNGPEEQDFEFKVPRDIPAGVNIFAWIWYNREQEFNMNCAAVKITPTATSADTPAASGYSSIAYRQEDLRPVTQTGNSCSCRCDSPPNIATCDCHCPGSCPNRVKAVRNDEPIPDAISTFRTSNGCRCNCESPSNIAACDCDCRAGACSQAIRSEDSSSVAFQDRPLMFVADDGNDCLTPHTTAELKYPFPGPDVVQGDGAYPLETPSGECGPLQMLLKQGYNGTTGNDGHD